MRLQPILEAFDDDASGFITITEMNHFTTSKPEEWRLVLLHREMPVDNISYVSVCHIGWPSGLLVSNEISPYERR